MADDQRPTKVTIIVNRPPRETEDEVLLRLLRRLASQGKGPHGVRA